MRRRLTADHDLKSFLVYIFSITVGNFLSVLSFAILYSLYPHLPILYIVFYMFPLALTSGVGVELALRNDIKQWLRRRLGTHKVA